MKRLTIFIVLLLLCAGIFLLISDDAMDASSTQDNQDNQTEQTVPSSADVPEIIREQYDPALASATFAGGCFWCTEAVFQETEGVKNAISGYAGGTEYNPSYQAVIRKQTSHREAIKVFYDPTVVTYEQLLDVYWGSIDPTDDGGQFVDRGFSYTTAIFYENDAQRIAAEESKSALQDSGVHDGDIVSVILPFTTFYEAEAYHQDFYPNSTENYKNYEQNSGREEFKAEIAKRLSEQ